MDKIKLIADVLSELLPIVKLVIKIVLPGFAAGMIELALETFVAIMSLV